MELYFLNEDLSTLYGPVDDFISAAWSERYYEVGTFAIHLPRGMLKFIESAAYVRTNGVGDASDFKCGRIDYICVMSGGDCEIGGRMLEGLLDERVVYGSGSISGGVSDSVMVMMNRNLRGLPVTLQDIVKINDEAVLSWEWDKLSDWLYRVLKPYGASFRVYMTNAVIAGQLPTPGGDDLQGQGDNDDVALASAITDIPIEPLETSEDKIVFRLVRGVNRSSEDEVEGCVSKGSLAVFSTSFGNILAAEYEKDISKGKNFAYIEGADGNIWTLDKSGGGMVREVYKKAADLTAEDFVVSGTVNMYQYNMALNQRGLEVLAGHPVIITVSADVDADNMPVCSLGDVCDVVDDELGVCIGMRLSGIDTVCENGCVRVYLQFGETIAFSDLVREKLR